MRDSLATLSMARLAPMMFSTGVIWSEDLEFGKLSAEQELELRKMDREWETPKVA